MGSTIRIRQLDMEGDFDRLLHLDRYINGERPRETVYREIEDYPGDIYVAEDSGQVVGFVSLSPLFWNRVAMIDHMAVDEEWRGKGVGKSLIRHVLEEALKRNARFVCVQTALWNFEAIEFYKRMGFSLRCILPEYIGDDNDMVWLDIDLRTM